MIEIRQFPCLSDNYGFLVRDQTSGAVAAIDTPDEIAINEALAKAGWRLTHILNTHHHQDHVGANLALKAKWRCRIIGPLGEAARIPGVDQRVGDGDVVELGESMARVIETPGHTLGHIVYWFEKDAAAFVGDTVFAMGCGRLFEGSAEQMWRSLSAIAALPEETKLYCAHEYTQSNARFALSVDRDNEALVARARAVDEARRRGEATVPTTIALERETNPFLRAASPALRGSVGMADASDAAVFAEIRKRKDVF